MKRSRNKTTLHAAAIIMIATGLVFVIPAGFAMLYPEISILDSPIMLIASIPLLKTIAGYGLFWRKRWAWVTGVLALCLESHCILAVIFVSGFWGDWGNPPDLLVGTHGAGPLSLVLLFLSANVLCLFILTSKNTRAEFLARTQH